MIIYTKSMYGIVDAKGMLYTVQCTLFMTHEWGDGIVRGRDSVKIYFDEKFVCTSAQSMQFQ